MASVVLHRLLRYAEVALKICFRRFASADMESAVASNRLEWECGDLEEGIKTKSEQRAHIYIFFATGGHAVM